AILSYMEQIYKMSDISINPTDATIFVSFVPIMATIVACVIIDKTGRKVLLYASGVIGFVGLLIMAIFHFVKEKEGQEFSSKYGYLPVVSLILYMIGFNIGYGPIPWLM